MTRAKYCVPTASGTATLLTSVNGLEVGVGDEVPVPLYTFVVTAHVAFLQNALPVFVVTERGTLQMDATRLEARRRTWTTT
jgi:dTDP-4-amino-4,6-dideoxygalactose transaminase